MKPVRLARFAGLLLAPVLAAGCSWIPGWLSEQEENDLVTHKRNSKAFLDVGDFARAEDQCRRGLAIDESDETLELTLGYALLFQGQPQKLEEAAQVFENAIGAFGTDDWRLLAGQGMSLQQLARQRADSEDPKIRAEAAGLRARARDSLEEAAEISGKTNNTPTDVLYHIALLDLEEERADLFPEHARAAFAKLQENEKFLAVKLDHPMGESERQRTDRDRRVNRERGRRIAREAARASWEAGDWKAASAVMDKLDVFGPLERSDHYDRARVREKAGDLEGAVRDYDKFVLASGDRTDDTVFRAVESMNRLRAELAERRTAAQLAPSSGR